MVLLGKLLKGRTTQQGEVGPARNIRIREQILTLPQYEAEKETKNLREANLKKQIQEEEAIFNINKKKLMANWRNFLRNQKLESLKEELEIYAQENQRELDNLDAYIQMLDKNIDEAEEQYNLALRNHLIQVDRLMEIRDSRIMSLREEFDRSWKILYDEFNYEALEIKMTHTRQKKELEDMMETIGAEEKQKQSAQADSAQTQMEQVKTKDKEEMDQMEGDLSSKQNNLSNDLETLFQKYTNDTKDKFTKYIELVNLNSTAERKNNATSKRIARTKERIDLMDIKTRQMEQELKQKNASLQREKDQLAKNCLDLWNKMKGFRENEHTPAVLFK